MTRTEIWSHVYESYGDSASNVVDVYIGYLRAKIDRDQPVKQQSHDGCQAVTGRAGPSDLGDDT